MNAATLSEVSVRCSFNTNIATLSITDFANYCQVEVEAAKEILAAIYDAKLVTSSAKSWKSPYFIRNVAVYLSNQAYLNAAAVEGIETDPAVLEADLVAAAEAEADKAEGDLDLLMAELEAAGLAEGEAEDDVILVEEVEIPADVATTKVDALEAVMALDGREVADQKAFRRAVRNQLSKHDLPWTIEAGTYYLSDPTNIYLIRRNGTTIQVTVG